MATAPDRNAAYALRVTSTDDHAGVVARLARGVLISHPHGNANVREAAGALADAGWLHSYWTGVSWPSRHPLGSLLPRRLRRQLERRALPPNLRPFARLHPWREGARLAAQALRLPRIHELAALSPNACHASLDRQVARLIDSRAGAGVAVVYAYDHGARESFAAAERRGCGRLYDLPIGYWRAHEAMLTAERERWPDWRDLAPTIDFRSPDFSRKDEEIALAERIIVPSRFVARTMAEHCRMSRPIVVVPFGAPPPVPLEDAELERRPNEPLRALFVGALELRKGVPYLAAALRLLGARVTATIVGRARAPCAPLASALAGHRWIESLPHNEVLARMRASDVFIFPTLFEGMALVVLEAMSQGCVVVTTPSSGAEDLIEHGVNGFIVPERAPEAIAEVVEALARQPERLRSLRLAAQRRAGERTWADYRAGLRAAIVGG